MFKNSLTIAFRFLWRNKAYSILNFLCLTFGLVCSIIGVLHVTYMFNYDKFHKNYDRLYEVEANVTFFNGDRFPKEYLSASLTDVLNENVPEIESLTRITNQSYTLVNGDKSFTEKGIYADENFPDMFSFPLISGIVKNALSEINSVVISERTAVKLFGSTDCLGKNLILKNENSQEGYKITGVLRNVPAQSYLQFDFIIPFSKFLAGNGSANEPEASATAIWALLNNNADVASVNNKIRDLIKTREATLNQELFLFPLKEKILYSYAGGKRVWREMQIVVIIGSIGFAILLIACFNFINLAIALNIKRYREAGIKKVVGARKSTIIIQYLVETFILTLISLFIAIDLVRLLLNGFNTIFNGDLHFNFTDYRLVLAFTAIALFTGLLSGLLPALYLSSSSPVNILKGKIVKSHSFSLFRQALIVFQFIIPVILIICMLIIRTQSKYMLNFDLGFNRDKLLIISNSENLDTHEESIKADLLSIPGIKSVSFSNCIPTRGTKVSNEVTWEGKDATEKLHFWCINTDFNYVKTVNIEITDGRYFDKSFPSDSDCYVINNVAAEVMKYKNPIGRSLTLEGKKGTIIGVFRNFHTIDLSGPFAPTIISVNSENRNNLLISLSSGTYSSITEKIGNVYRKYEPDKVFQASLFSDLKEYRDLSTPSKLVGAAFFIALLLACLGLSGLASFTAQSRTKEIGIRKTSGATTLSVMHLLGVNYTKWLIIAVSIALPIAFLLGNLFLSRFHFHTSMPIWAFIVGPIIACLFALSAVSWQSWRASTRNPVEALRYE
jgi:putative ABC transport system permease protein